MCYEVYFIYILYVKCYILLTYIFTYIHKMCVLTCIDDKIKARKEDMEAYFHGNSFSTVHQ